MTEEVRLVEKTADTGITHFGVRAYLASPNLLHHTPEDDDRSAITFWVPESHSFTPEDLVQLFTEMRDTAIEAAHAIAARKKNTHA